MSRASTTVQPGERFVYLRSSGCVVRRSVRRCRAAHFREAARGMQCEIWSESGRDQSLASGRLLSLGFAQRVSAAARFKPHERPSASFGERVMPPSDRVVVQQEHRGDTPASYQAHYSEKIVYLLNSYQSKYNRHQTPARVFDRRREGYHGCLRKRGLSRRRPTPGSERHAKPVLDRRFSRDRVDHGPNETSPLERSRSKGDSLGPRHIIELAAFRFSNHLGYACVEPGLQPGRQRAPSIFIDTKIQSGSRRKSLSSRRSKSRRWRPKLKVAGSFVVLNVTELAWPVAALAL
jgi:hypothetical protein